MLVSLWVQEGNVEGFPCRQRCEPPDPQSRRNRTRDAAVEARMRAYQSCRAPWAKRQTKPLEKPPPLSPRTSEGSACGRQTLPLTRTLASRTLSRLHKPHSMTRTPDPLFILDTFPPLDTLFYYFC